MIPSLILTFLSVLFVACLCILGLNIASSGISRISMPWLLMSALAGGALGFLAQLMGFSIYTGGILSLFGALLLSAAFVDRETGWAPDILTLPLSILAALVGGALSEPGATWIGHVLIGVGVFAASQALWIGSLLLLGVRLPPPGDLIAMALPLVVFGIGPTSGIIYIAISLSLIFMIRSPGSRHLLRKKEVMDEISQECAISQEEAESSVTLLALILPITFVALSIILLCS